ncbi:hypothetical protein EJB05_40312 [Eragrostis curvula]|uniref:SET domain-containing protein n=1 Tax=Eragrostis curvula TaxID=38414 RepID=A0A5J9TZR4_9POAL|nr:hypothetical protein EJB05_40312 [Eragrostis curvula]
MVSQSGTTRARRALDAMKALGFSKKEAIPVLKSLLNLFDNSWEPIEDESYRALADAILDARDRSQNNGEREQCGRTTSLVPLPPEDDHNLFSTPLAMIDTSCDLDSETDAPRIKRPTHFSTALRLLPSATDGTMSLSPLGESNGPQTRVPTQSRQSMADGMPSSVPAHKRARQMLDEDFQHAVFFKEPKPEPELDAVQYSAPSSSCKNAAQVAIISHPLNISSSSHAADPPHNQYTSKISGSKGRAVQDRRTTTAAPTSFGKPVNIKMKQPQIRENDLDHRAVMQNTGTGSAVKNTQKTTSLHTVVASSSTGDVEMSIKCSLDPSNFHMPDLEAVFKMVEDKSLRSCKVLPPDFSIGSLMNEICQCVVEMVNYHSGEHNVQSDAVDNGRNSQNESMTCKALFMEPVACMNNEGENDQSVEESLVLEASQSGPPNTTVAQQPHLALSHLRPTHDVSDISKGEEKVRISVVNEFGGPKCPPFFYYTPKNIVFRKAHVNISVARIGDEDCCADCFGNCLSAPVPCACARETGGEFAYTPDGLVRTAFLDECVSMNRFPEKHHKFFCKSCLIERSRNEASPEPCRGHLVRKFIKECWTKCGCNMQCGNRVVQRGMTCNLQIFFTHEGKGWGLRTLDELPKGSFVCEYVGELLTSTELYERTSQNLHNGRCMHPVLLDANWCSEGVLKDEEALCLDATFYGNVGRFINHRCYDANLVEIPVEVETPDRHYYRLAFFTTKKVEPFEELTWDYGIDFDDDKTPANTFECLCGSRYCRGRKNPRKRGKAAAN